MNHLAHVLLRHLERMGQTEENHTTVHILIICEQNLQGGLNGNEGEKRGAILQEGNGWERDESSAEKRGTR